MDTFVKLMDNCACMIGNSSSAIREGAIIGVTAVNIGSRQQGRERGANVIDVHPNRTAILDAIETQLNHGKYASDTLYGDGTAGEQISKILAEIELEKVPIQKRILI